jgi:hypothetical protein
VPLAICLRGHVVFCWKRGEELFDENDKCFVFYFQKKSSDHGNTYPVRPNGKTIKNQNHSLIFIRWTRNVPNIVLKQFRKTCMNFRIFKKDRQHKNVSVMYGTLCTERFLLQKQSYFMQKYLSDEAENPQVYSQEYLPRHISI